jgi:hypothetical protein
MAGKDFGVYIPREMKKDVEEVPDTFEQGAMQVFGLGPSRLDLEHSAAAKKVRHYQTADEKILNGIVIAARKLFLESQPLNAENIIKEWDHTLSAQAPDLGFVRAYIDTDEFQKKMDSVGAHPRNGLTSSQIAMITTLTYPDGKSLVMKLKKHKIPWVTFQGWLKQPKFLEHLKLTAEQALSASEAFGIIQLVNQSSNGSKAAIDTVLAMTGRWDPANRKQVDAQKMVGIILQVVDEEIHDPAVKERIGNRLSLLSSSASLDNSVLGELD